MLHRTDATETTPNLLPSPLGDKMLRKKLEGKNELNELPSPRGDKMLRGNIADYKEKVGLPSPRGDKMLYEPKVWCLYAYRCYRPLAGIKCFAYADIRLLRSTCYRPLAGIKCVHVPCTVGIIFTRYRPLAGIKCFDITKRRLRKIAEVTVPSRG